MNLEQVLYVAARIHAWDRGIDDVIARAMAIVKLSTHLVNDPSISGLQAESLGEFVSAMRSMKAGLEDE